MAEHFFVTTNGRGAGRGTAHRIRNEPKARPEPTPAAHGGDCTCASCFPEERREAARRDVEAHMEEARKEARIRSVDYVKPILGGVGRESALFD